MALHQAGDSSAAQSLQTQPLVLGQLLQAPTKCRLSVPQNKVKTDLMRSDV